jgi:hypothetical protein
MTTNFISRLMLNVKELPGLCELDDPDLVIGLLPKTTLINNS